MIEYLYQLPSNVLGHNMLGYLDIIDIIQLETAAASHQSQQLLKAILPYGPPIQVSRFQLMTKAAIIWLNKRSCRVQHVKIAAESLCEICYEDSVLNNIEIYLKQDISLRIIEELKKRSITQSITRVRVHGDQDPAVMEVLFSLLIDSSVHSLNIQSSNQSQWIEYILNLMLT